MGGELADPPPATYGTDSQPLAWKAGELPISALPPQPSIPVHGYPSSQPIESLPSSQPDRIARRPTVLDELFEQETQLNKLDSLRQQACDFCYRHDPCTAASDGHVLLGI